MGLGRGKVHLLWGKSENAGEKNSSAAVPGWPADSAAVAVGQDRHGDSYPASAGPPDRIYS